MLRKRFKKGLQMKSYGVTQKKIKVDRANPLIRIPALLFRAIDKRKRKIPLIITFDNLECSIIIDQDKLNV